MGKISIRFVLERKHFLGFKPDVGEIATNPRAHKVTEKPNFHEPDDSDSRIRREVADFAGLRLK